MKQLSLAFCLMLASVALQGCSPAAVKGNGEEPAKFQERPVSEPYWKDLKIETRAIDLIYDQVKVYMHVNVASFNGNILLSGEVPDETTRTEIGKIVSGVEGVRHLNNELAIAENSSLVSRSNDSLITSSVKLRFVRDSRFNAGDIRVVTENGVVFLMGNVKRAEADAAADVASTTSRVKRVVKLFEYTD